MLFIFQVDTGRMMTFDMAFTLVSVQDLKKHIEKECKIPADKQVLLISGGDYLTSEARVCSFSAGTDTNPIYLFSKAIVESTSPPVVPIDQYSEYTITDLAAKYRESLELPPALETVVKRALFAQDLHELSMEQLSICDKLVAEHHNQHLGWSAVTANLSDLEMDLRHRLEVFQAAFRNYTADREIYINSLKHFKDDLEILQRIPVLPTLIESERTEVPENNDSAEEKPDKPENMTLLDWISKKDVFLDHLYEYCSKGLAQLNEDLFQSMCSKIEEALHIASNEDMKTVAGLDDRLFGLGQLLEEAKGIVKEQMELAQSFQKNKARATNLKEPSIWPDLCAMHVQQLKILFKNHNHLRDITKRMLRAKSELCVNLHQRLKWIVWIENRLFDLDNELVFSFEKLLNLKRQLEILQQVHVAPAMYLSAVAEVVRRRHFSQSFLLWASELACHLLTIHNEELARRNNFQAQFEGHFLSSLFPGMEDMPPMFGTQAPSIFDSALPKVTEDDLEYLKQELPDLADHLSVSNTTVITNIFMQRSVKCDVDKIDEAKGVDEKLIQAVADAGLASTIDQNLLKVIENEPALTTTPHGLPHLKDLDRGCESETDTEEFEKVGQSPFELNFEKGVSSPRSGTQDAATLTEVGERYPLPPKKPPRSFQKQYLIQTQYPNHQQEDHMQRTLSISGSNTESFTNIKNPSLESIDELSSLKNFGSNTESCFNSHYQQGVLNCNNLLQSKSISPHTPSPKVEDSPNEILCHQQTDFINDEFYIDESLPSSLSIETGHSQGEFVKQLDTAHNVVALLQDNLSSSRSDHEKLKFQFVKMGCLIRERLAQLRNELYGFKTHVFYERNLVEQHCESLGNSWENLIADRDNKEREIIQRITVDHELEISDFRKIAQGKNEEIKTLKEVTANLEEKNKRFVEENSTLQKQIEKTLEECGKDFEDHKNQMHDLQIEHEKNMKEMADRLRCEHRGEIENIRARFKLMTMERSPSENSLEKIESSSEAILLQLRENFESEKEIAISDAVTKEAEKWHIFLDEKLKEIQTKFEQEKSQVIEEISNKISHEKDKQIDTLREEMKNLTLECFKHKGTIQQLVECEAESLKTQTAALQDKINLLECEKGAIEIELGRLKRERSLEMSTSVSICEGKSEASTNVIKQHKKKDTSTSKFVKISIDSCKPGDLVFVVWEPKHQNFRVFQQCGYLYFLHSDCMKNLGLEVIEGVPNKIFCLGEMVDKEYCHARKKQNRFNVPLGAKFFRVIVRPVKEIQPAIQSTSISVLQQQYSMSQSQISSTSVDVITGSEIITSLPSSPNKEQSLNWEQQPPQSPIPEEIGGENVGEVVEGIVEKGKEVTENFDETQHDSKNIDR